MRESYPWEFVRAFADAGWLGVLIPEAYGGAGLGLTEARPAAAGDRRVGRRHERRGGDPLLRVPAHADHPPRLGVPEADLSAARGARRAAGGLRRDRADRRLGHLAHHAPAPRTTATRWVISGQKVWTTNAQHAERILLLARTSPRRAEAPLDGLTLFFAPLDRESARSARSTSSGARRSTATRCSSTAWRCRRRRRRRGRARLLSPAGRAQSRAHRHCARGGWDRAVGGAVRLATMRASGVVFDRPIGQNQAIAHPLADAWAQLQAAELLAYKAAWLFDHGQAVRRRGQRCQAAGRARRLSRVRRWRCRRSAASATRARRTSSGCGARCACTASRRSPRRWCSTIWPSTCWGCQSRIRSQNQKSAEF